MRLSASHAATIPKGNNSHNAQGSLHAAHQDNLIRDIGRLREDVRFRLSLAISIILRPFISRMTTSDSNAELVHFPITLRQHSVERTSRRVFQLAHSVFFKQAH